VVKVEIRKQENKRVLVIVERKDQGIAPIAVLSNNKIEGMETNPPTGHKRRSHSFCSDLRGGFGQGRMY
jgi:hypothetical protein